GPGAQVRELLLAGSDHLALDVLGHGAALGQELLRLDAGLFEDLLLLRRQLTGSCLGLLGLLEPLRDPELALLHLASEHGPSNLAQDEERDPKGHPGPNDRRRVE